ncbi:MULTISPECIES: flagella basal body P-ring formation protein FlgA [Micrococcaceae]|uniref:flagella basal body P-ring formation protein FlgA n=1 Tax=Micrococcaceae TaxID=1268 RepID=UPI0010E26B4C|nr:MULTISPECIES: flagella basal body P-ring formation protein FlgA [unclassified Arthrobacter]TDU25495.1 flagellar basal body P-ring formation chaperone FlgA [Arthrobacter sp. JUb115]
MITEQIAQDARTTSASRVRRPSWKDPRLALGAVLVVASVAGTVYLVGELHQTSTVYVASTNITLGEKLTSENMKTQEVQLGETLENYLHTDAQLGQDARANTFISEGQLIPVTSIMHSEVGSRRPVNVDLPADLSSSITPGSFVDVWIAKRETSGSTYGVPEKLSSMVEVAARVESGGGLVGTQGTNLELLVEPNQLEPLLQALANESRIIVVYNPAGTEQ